MNYTEPIILGPRQTNRFEVFSPRLQTVHALEMLAQTGAIELGINPRVNAGLEVRTTVDILNEFDQLARPYHAYLPDHVRRPHALDATPDQTARQAVTTLQRWIAEISPILECLSLKQTERDNLLLLREYIQSFGDTHKDLSLLPQANGLLYKGLYACPLAQSLNGVLANIFKEMLTGLRHRFLILVGLPESAPEIESAIQAGTCYRIDVPVWLAPENAHWPSQVDARLQVLANGNALWRRALDAAHNDANLRVALGDIDLRAEGPRLPPPAPAPGSREGGCGVGIL